VPTTELARPTSVLALFCGGTDLGSVVDSMRRRLPDEGLSTGRMRPRFDLTRATYRLLDSRILEAAATSLDQDVAEPFVQWLSRFQNLREAAVKAAPGTDGEELVVLKEPTPFTSSQGSDVVVWVGDDKVATVAFHLDLKLEIGKTSVAVRHGAIEEVLFAICSATASFTLEGCPKPLWKPEPVALPDVHLRLDPPFAVPLVEVPRPRSTSDQAPPRPAQKRPPVPGKHRQRRA
jgi:hypothetical protein